MPSVANLDSDKSFLGPTKAINNKTKTRALKTQGKKLHCERQVTFNWLIIKREENLNDAPSLRLCSIKNKAINKGIKNNTKGVLNSGNIPCFELLRVSVMRTFNFVKLCWCR